MQIEIGTEVFPTKKSATERCRAILHSYSTGDKVSDVHAAFLRDLLDRHPSADQKIGVGIKEFRVQHDEWGGKCFWIFRTDGSCTDFSFVRCITPRSEWQKFTSACRHAIASQIILFRESAFGSNDRIPCAFSGVMIARNESHVDHVPPDTFDALLKRFVEGKRWESIATFSGDGCFGRKFSDEAFEKEWFEWHAKHARLRVVSAKANLSDIRKESP